MTHRRPMMLALMLAFCMSLLMVAMSCSDNDDDDKNPTTLPTATPTPDATPTAPTNEYNILGVWAYTMAQGGETWDSGTITFTGTAASGTFLQKTVFNAEYSGTYTVSGNAVSLKGPEDWTGTFSDANTMSGTWSSNDTPDTGTWTMTRTE
ncbi:hypothetical protein U14_02175 [Candidatus Moduliflexus flocculans]|uniref:Lipocalin-like domain-containing protein n=1 Tax=Candidatus Moduliflexus flocculans TaxID=1499966 RepID=A0A0S6VTR3_9BACT|nr:hypothetical protein U14_02175 [Candidatus Moduliflexus flocculans]